MKQQRRNPPTSQETQDTTLWFGVNKTPGIYDHNLARLVGTARPRLVRMTGPEKNRTNQKRTIYLLKPKITLKSAKTRAKS